MDFTEISDEDKVHPGEYLLHTPTNQIVMCGAFNRVDNFIRAFGNGKYIEDKIAVFKKIQVPAKERKTLLKKRRCGGCKG